jgi:hypothetical protein
VTWGKDRSYVKKCSGSCRRGGSGGNVHSKFFLFSRTGTARNVVMVSSSNLNRGGAQLGWNDLVVMKGRKKSFAFYNRIHHLMTAERRVGPTERPAISDGRNLSRFFPIRNASKATDPTLRDLNGIRCRGPLGRTQIHISMFYWKGPRGQYLVDKLVSLSKAGCRVSIIYGAPSVEIAQRLRNIARAGRIQLWDSRWDFDDDGWNEVRTHAKYVLVKGRYRGNPRAFRVWTGSQNWVAGSLSLSDESTVNIASRAVYRQYLRNWNAIRVHSRKMPG